MPESPDLSIHRVQSYMPDNVSARLSCQAPNLQTTLENREKAMRTFLDKLVSLMEARGEVDGKGESSESHGT
jgi:hypothetical protein